MEILAVQSSGTGQQALRTMRLQFKRIALAALLMVFGRCATAAEFFQLDRQYEQKVSGYWEQTFPFDGSDFYGLASTGRPGQIVHHVVGIDALNGSAKNLTQPDGRGIVPAFFVGDLVVAYEGVDGTISLFDRRTFQRLASTRIAGRAVGAALKDNVLFLLQIRNPRSYRDGGHFLAKFALPNLDFLGEERPAALPTLMQAFLLEDTIVGFQYAPKPELVALTLDGKETARIPMPTARERPGRSCGGSVDALVGVRALIRMACGEYAVVDLDQARIVYRIPMHRNADVADFAVSDGLLFVRPKSQYHLSPAVSDIRVFDFESGRELARTDLPEGELLASPGELILKRVRQRETLDVQVYTVNKAYLYDEARARQDIVDASQRAETAQNSYGALDAMESVSLSPILGVPAYRLDDELFTIATSYARYLALHPRHVGEGIRLLARLRAGRPWDGQLRSYTEAASQRAIYFHGNPAAREKALWDAWAALPAERPLVRSVIGRPRVNVAVPHHPIRFHDDRVFMACTSCVSVEVRDRSTWAHIASVPIMQRDGDKEEAISDIAFVNDRMFVSLENRYPSRDDVNFHVFDLNTLERLAATAIPENGALLVPGENILGICNANSAACRVIDATSLQSVNMELRYQTARNILRRLDSRRIAPGPTPAPAWDVVQLPAIANQYVEYLSSSTVVSRSLPGVIYEIRPANGEGELIRFEMSMSFQAAPFSAFFQTEDKTHLLIGAHSIDSIRFYAIDLANKETRILLELPIDNYRGAATDGRTLFLAFPQTVIAVDIITGNIIDGMDPNGEVDSVLVADNKLIVQGSGGSLLLLDLKRFYEPSVPARTPFEQTGTVLSPIRGQ